MISFLHSAWEMLSYFFESGTKAVKSLIESLPNIAEFASVSINWLPGILGAVMLVAVSLTVMIIIIKIVLEII